MRDGPPRHPHRTRLGAGGPAVVLLHGMCGSHHYWGGAFDALAADTRLVVPDLLGFGASPKPIDGYGPEDHAAALAACLAEAGIDDPAVVVGHSMGALVAVALAQLHPRLVDRLVLLAPPLYDGRIAARRHVRAMGVIEHVMAFDPPAANLCAWMCRHRSAAARLAVLLRPDLPPALARDAVRHTWQSYSLSMERLILSGFAADCLGTLACPVRIVVAADDPVPDLAVLRALRARNRALDLEVWPRGGHDLPLTRSAACVDVVRRSLPARARSAVASAPVPVASAGG